jgi:2-polyprenyl-3-methyl-5-hydroxy-6-metoxy-1,4-benzoquinol methylase
LTLPDNIHTFSYKHDPAIHNFSAAKQILPFLFKLKHFNSVLDVGCGTGTWLAIAKELGINEFLGIDGINLNQEELKIPMNNFINCDLTSPINLNKKFDLLLCLEVAEHLPPENAGTFVEELTRHSDFIVFSAAIPNQGGQNHLNEQWPDYWQKLFFKNGYYPSEIIRNYFWDNKDVEWWYKQNIIIYASKSMLSSLNLVVSENVKSIVHPALFNEQLDIIGKLHDIIQKELWSPSFKKSIKNLIKSIIK